MLFDFEGYRSDIRNQSSLLCRAEFLKVCHRDITNRSVSSLIQRSRGGLLQMQSSGVSLSFICHPPGAFGEEHLYRASAERNSQKTADEMRRDWFQQNIYWQPWEEEIITTLTSFDHGYSYSQNVSVDRTMRWRAGSSCEFALLFFFPLPPPACIPSEQELCLAQGETRRTKWGQRTWHGRAVHYSPFWFVEAETRNLMMAGEMLHGRTEGGSWVIRNL